MDVLVIEDCFDTFLLIEHGIQPHRAIHAKSLSQARKILKEANPHVILLDIELPDGNGVKFCNELSKDPLFSAIPRILLTARSGVDDKVFGLNCGADDYVTKPFEARELKARCEARVRTPTEKASTMTVEPFLIRPDFQKISVLDAAGTSADLNLTPTEFKLFYCLIINPNTVLSRHELVRRIWKENGTSIEIRGLDTHMSHLRKKLGPYAKCLISIYGKGYTFDPSNLGARVA